MSTNKYLKRSQNRGVNVQSDTENSQSLATSRDGPSVHSGTDRDYGQSINKIKNDVKTVIDLMGPVSPKCENSSAVEESYRKVAEDTKKLYKDTSEELDQTISEDYHLTTDCDQSIMPTDNVNIYDTDLLSVTANENSPMPCTNMYPPPVMPVNFVYNSECMCPQMANYLQAYAMQGQNRTCEKKSLVRSFLTVFRNRKRAKNCSSKSKYYKINIQQSRKNIVPSRLVFDLVDKVHTKADNLGQGDFITDKGYYMTEDNHFSLPPDKMELKQSKKKDKYVQINNQNKINNILHKNITSYNNCSTKEKINQKDAPNIKEVKKDVYYFDHGCTSYFQTTDQMPVIVSEDLALRTEAYTTKFWAELFGSFNIGFSFLMSFILQLIRFILYSTIRPMTVGVLQIISDYFFKPLLTTLFNSVIQPILIFFYNIVTSLRDICDPVAEALGYFFSAIAILISAFRIVEVKTDKEENYRKFSRNRKILFKPKRKDKDLNNLV